MKCLIFYIFKHFKLFITDQIVAKAFKSSLRKPITWTLRFLIKKFHSLFRFFYFLFKFDLSLFDSFTELNLLRCVPRFFPFAHDFLSKFNYIGITCILDQLIERFSKSGVFDFLNCRYLYVKQKFDQAFKEMTHDGPML